MDLEVSPLKTGILMRENFIMDSSMERVNLHGPMESYTLENLLITESLEKGSINGPTRVFTKEKLRTGSEMVWENIRLTRQHMKGNGSKAKKQERVK
jgi:hypothetical protein